MTMYYAVMIYTVALLTLINVLFVRNSLKVALYFQHLLCSRLKVLLIEVEY